MKLKNVFGKNKERSKSAKEKRFEKIEIDLEKAKAQIEIINDTRKVGTERSNKINEEVGELRGMISDREKEIKDLAVKVVHASELVNQAKPEKLMFEIERQKAGIEVLKGRMESYHKISDKIMVEFKKIRKEMAVFKGVSQIIKISNKSKEDLDTMYQIKSELEREANKTEKILIRMQSMYEDFTRYKKMSAQVRDEFRELLKQIDKVKIENLDLPKHGFSLKNLFRRP